MKLYRPTTILVGVLFVLAGGAVRLGLPDQVFEESHRWVKKGSIGEKIEIDDSSVTVTRVRFAKSVLPKETDEKAVQTDGIYVAVEYDSVRGVKDPGSLQATLTTDGGSVYEPIAETIGTSVQFPAPGFAESGSLVFELNPADVKGLTLMLKPTALFTVLTQDFAVDLGLPSDGIVQEQIDRATDEYLIPKNSIRVAG